MDVAAVPTISYSKWNLLDALAANLEQLQSNLIKFHGPNQSYTYPSK